MNVVIDVILLALMIRRQVTPRPLSSSYRLPVILVIVGLLEFGAFLLGGGQQLAQFLKGQQSFTTIPEGSIVIAALIGSLGIAVVSAAIRAPTFRLWWQDGQYWRKGTGVTLLLWIVSLGAHLLYDSVISRNSALSGLGSATILLYFAASLTIQRWFLAARASQISKVSGLSGPSTVGGAR